MVQLYVKGYGVIPFLSWGAAESIKNDLENPQEKQAHFKVPSRQGRRKKYSQILIKALLTFFTS